MRRTFWAIGAVAAVALEAVAAEPERKVYAHYMGCWPAVACQKEDQRLCDSGLKAALRDEKPEDYVSRVGGRIVNKPLLPYAYDISLLEDAKLEIRRAIRAGIDGFAIDAWAGDNSPVFMDTLFRAAEEMKVDFGITICFDNSCHGAKWITGAERWERFVCSAHRVLDAHMNSPNLARFHGKPLFFGYGSGWIVDFKKGESPAELRRRVKEAWQKWRKALPCEVYLHGCIGKFIDANNPEKNDWEGIAKDCAETFDTIGAFLGTDGEWGTKSPLWEYARKSGCGWSQPLFWQYSNKRGGIITDAGLGHLHRNWRLAIERGSELLQFVTWNDYGEETILAPSYGSNYTVSRVNRWYAELWKTGKEPVVEKDEVHVIFRRTAGDAPSFPFLARRCRVPEELEIVTFLKEPSTVQVKDYGEYEAPKGMFVKRFPLKPGIVAARVRRSNALFIPKTVCGVIAPERVSAKRWREDMTEVAYGSNFEDEWKLDFPDAKPLRYSEMGDEDNDGLPNWFEMVYFGTFPDMSTATCADPNADPDKDGFTNLQEYENDTNPLKADTSYPKGFAWRLSDLRTKNPYVGNPARDAKGRPVWRFTYRFGAEGEKYIPGEGGPFDEIHSAGGSVHGSGFHVYLPNPKQGNRRVGGFDTGIVFRDPTNGVARVRVNRDTPVAVEWTAPVGGTVDVEVLADRAPKGCAFKVFVENGGHALATGTADGSHEVRLVAKSVRVRSGETVRIVFTTPTGGGGPTLEVKDVVLVLR